MSTHTADEVRDELRHARASGRLHGAYLIDGPDGTGKRELAHWLARLLLCTAQEQDPCGRCPGCRKSGLDPETGEPRHADWQRLEPDGASFKIEQVRQLQRALSLRPQEGGHRVGLLLGADALTIGAANALLKTLEEPPERTTLILVARSGDVLPPTIRSRALRLRLRAQRPARIAAALESAGTDPEDAWLAATLGGGSLESARAWIEEHGEVARDLLARLREAPRSPDSELLALGESFRGSGDAVRQRTHLFLDVYEALARRTLLEAAAGGPGAQRALDRWLERAESAARARRELARRNLNAQMVVEGLLFDLRAPAA